MTEQPTFGSNNIGEGPTGDPSVLKSTDKAPQAPQPNAGVLPDVWEDGTVAAVNAAEQGTLPGDEIEVKPAGTVETPELKPGNIGYTENTGSDPVLK